MCVCVCVYLVLYNCHQMSKVTLMRMSLSWAIYLDIVNMSLTLMVARWKGVYSGAWKRILSDR